MSQTQPTSADAATQTKRSQPFAWSSWVSVAIIVVLIVVFVGVPLLGPAPSSQALQHPAVGEALPAVDLRPVTGFQPSVSSGDLSGKVVMVNLWASWCGPCRNEFPHVVEIHRKFGDRGAFQLLSIPVSVEDPIELKTDTEEFLQQRGVELPTYTDPSGRTQNAITALTGEGGIPQTVIADQQGVVRGVWIGFAEPWSAEMEELIQQLLAEG